MSLPNLHPNYYQACIRNFHSSLRTVLGERERNKVRWGEKKIKLLLVNKLAPILMRFTLVELSNDHCVRQNAVIHDGTLQITVMADVYRIKTAGAIITNPRVARSDTTSMQKSKLRRRLTDNLFRNRSV